MSDERTGEVEGQPLKRGDKTTEVEGQLGKAKFEPAQEVDGQGIKVKGEPEKDGQTRSR